MGEDACVKNNGMSEIEIAGQRLMEAIQTNARLVNDAKEIVIDPRKPADPATGRSILEAPQTLTEFINNMTSLLTDTNNEMQSINAVLHNTLGTNIHLG